MVVADVRTLVDAGNQAANIQVPEVRFAYSGLEQCLKANMLAAS